MAAPTEQARHRRRRPPRSRPPTRRRPAERAAPRPPAPPTSASTPRPRRTGEAIRALPARTCATATSARCRRCSGCSRCSSCSPRSTRGGTFPSLLNLANLLQQGAGQTIIAMGLVFVLLIGEIDLAAGTASGLTAAVMALHLVQQRQPARRDGHHGVRRFRRGSWPWPSRSRCWLRIWAGAAFAGVGAGAAASSGFPPNPWLEMLLAVCVGVVIGCSPASWSPKVGMPSFVVTLALFIAWQGVILQLIGDGGTLGLRDPVLVAVANGNLSTAGQLAAVRGGARAATRPCCSTGSSAGASSGSSPSPPGLVLIKIGAVVLLAAVATFLLTLDRSPGAMPIAGVPYVVPIVLVLLVAGHVRCSTGPGSAGTSTRSAATGRRRAGPASTSSRIRGVGVRDLLGVRGDRRDRLLVEGRLGLARAPVAATRCCSRSAPR